MTASDCFEIGYIAKTKGLKGEVQVSFSYHEPEKLKLEAVFIAYDGKMIPHFVTAYKIPQKQMGYFLFEDIDHIDKAQKIVHKKIFLANTFKPKKKKDEFSFKDLEGFTVTDVTFGLLGQITEVKEFPKQYIAALMYKEKEILFPLSDDLIIDIAIDNQTITINLPDGLIAIYME
jgi:16S rRNA processing protein RimM